MKYSRMCCGIRFLFIWVALQIYNYFYGFSIVKLLPQGARAEFEGSSPSLALLFSTEPPPATFFPALICRLNDPPWASMLTLQHFVLKSQAIALYRTAVRTSRGGLPVCSLIEITRLPNSSSTNLGIPDPQTRRETVAWIRSEFEQHRYETDVVRPNLHDDHRTISTH